MRCKHLFCERILKYHHLGSDVRSFIREDIEPKSKILTFRIVDSPGNNLVNPMVWRCRESAKLNICVFVCVVRHFSELLLLGSCFDIKDILVD